MVFCRCNLGHLVVTLLYNCHKLQHNSRCIIVSLSTVILLKVEHFLYGVRFPLYQNIKFRYLTHIDTEQFCRFSITPIVRIHPQYYIYFDLLIKYTDMTNQINNKNLLNTSSKSLWVWGLIYDRQHHLLTLTNMLFSKYVGKYETK